MVEFLHYQKRLEGMFQLRNSAQFGFDLSADLEPELLLPSHVNIL